MEPDKKRSFDEVELLLGDLPVSKKPLQTLSEDGPLTQQDVVYYQKEAIWRQMTQYKLQASELSSQLALYQSQFETFTEVLLLLESWYTAVLVANGDERPLKLTLTETKEEIETVLDERKRKLALLLQPLVKSEDAADEGDSIFDVVALSAEKEALRSQNEKLQEQVLVIHAQLESLRKQADRAASASIKRIHDSTHATEDRDTNGKSHQHNGLAETASAAAAAAESAAIAEAASSADKEALESLKVQFEELKGGYEQVTKQLKESRGKLEEVETTSNDLRSRLANLSDSDLRHSSAYMTLVDKNNQLQEQLRQTSKSKEELATAVKAHEAQVNVLIGGINKELENENVALKDLLSKAENDLVRVRAARDELLGKQALLKSELESKKTNEALLKVNEILNERIEKLTQEKSADTNANFDSLEKAELVKRLLILSTDLTEIEQAFEQTRSITLEKLRNSVDHEAMIKKLTIEKNKADQKYFASMRSKDALVTENKQLKSQISKTQELLAKMTEIEKNLNSKIDVLSKSINDYRTIKEGAIHETTKFQEQLRLLAKSREALGKELVARKAEVVQLKKENGEVGAELKAKAVNHSKLEAKLKATEALLQKYKQNNTLSILQEDERQMEAMRSITKCSVCLKNWKNMAITVCGHVFCDGCVQERLAARLRRCPSCNKGFSANDLLAIHL